MMEYSISKLRQLALAVKGKHRVAACCYDRKGRVLSYGTNSYTKTHPKQLRFATEAGNACKQFLHAEIAALVRCREVPYKIKVIRVGKNGELKLAKPCPICSLAILEAGVTLVEFSVG